MRWRGSGRHVMRRVGGIAVLGVLAAVLIVVDPVEPSARLAAEESSQPNIVLIITDDMRVDQLDTMPFVNSQLVEKGRSFLQAFTTGPICCPSRGSFLRGQYVHTHSTY